jgi:hypothetical protein
MRSLPKAHRLLTVFLILLFSSLSFNAYACIIPLFGTTAASMGNGCSVPEEHPIRQFCDAFTTLGVQSAGEFHQTFDWQTICSEDTALLSQLLSLAWPASRLPDHPAESPPEDLLLKISVLRI